MTAADRRLPLASLMRGDGAVVIPPGEAREVLRLVLIGAEALVRSDGGEVSPRLRRILYALHDASQLKNAELAGTAGSGSARGAAGTIELSVGQAAELLGCSPRWVRQLVLAGPSSRLPLIRLHHGRGHQLRLFLRGQLQQLRRAASSRVTCSFSSCRSGS